MFASEIGHIDTPLALALGSFDGLHLGHRAVISAVTDNPYTLTPAVASFSPHPREVLFGSAPAKIISDEDKAQELCRMGVEAQICFDFRAVKNMTPDEFLNLLCKRLNIGMLSCGYNFRFGKNGEGDTKILADYCEGHNIHFCVADKVELDNVPVCSTAIRRYITSGDIERANRMLGRAIKYQTTVSNGDRRGRTIGFPTVNQPLPNGVAEPKYGVYVSTVEIDGRQYPGITNFGIRPTYKIPVPQFETFILDYTGDLYYKKLPLRLYRFIRPEMKFSSLEELKAAIARDCEAAKNYIFG